MGKFILWLSACVFIGYGLVSLLAPTVPAGFAGLILGNGDAYAEISAMYGGLQTGLGLYCLLAALRPEFYRAGLALLLIGIGSLAIARSIGALTTAEPLSLYTWGALGYEYMTALIAALALRKASTHSN